MKIWKQIPSGTGTLFMLLLGMWMCWAPFIFAKLEEPKKSDAERARFMLECTYDWSLSPETCRNILNGDDPPIPPPEYDGC